MPKILPPTGFRDFLPEDCQQRAHLISTIEQVYESFGYEPSETPAVERLDILLGKGAGENEKLLFKILKRGESLQQSLATGREADLADLGLRYDLTVPLARYIASNSGSLSKIFKRYQIGPVWRADRPQRGRFREFLQCDVDVIGSSAMLAEADLFLATSAVFARLGFRSLTLRLNSRPLLPLLIRTLGVPADLVSSALIALDKLDKVGVEGVTVELETRGVSREVIQTIFNFREVVSRDSNNENLVRLRELLGRETAIKITDAQARQADKQISLLWQILSLCPQLPVGEIKIDPFLVRGMDYYTGPIFEISVPGVPFAVAGGGRYDNLIGILTSREIPATGFSIGFERLYELMKTQNMLPGRKSACDLIAVIEDESLERETLLLAGRLRQQGLATDVYPQPDSLPIQYRYAEQKGIPFAVMLTSESLQKNAVIVRDLSARKSSEMKETELGAFIRSRRKSTPEPRKPERNGI